ncbi:DUF3159 domain-containing protein [uncultured Nocardioides sp.]|uniref:DUF3159 domain-containing protein n=1 Tax=uncultured Nocardioides sp. TaxID=198441 RepID=UPI0026043EC6|nr:DUF3159 domain-containing protein [uncultured Nocardioides sp.]
MTEPSDKAAPASTQTVEQVVRGQLSTALGGVRGMVEAAVPTLVFTALWLTSRDLRLALICSVGAALVLLVVRLVQRSSVQFVLNALFGIGIGALFVTLSARSGGTEDEQALAYFLPGLIYNAGYAALMALSCLTRWPVVGFMVGSVTGDPTAWRSDPQVVKLCTRLTWLLVLPCVVRVVLQGPLWLGANGDVLPVEPVIAALGVMKVVLGWPLQVGALAAMAWVLGRNATPVAAESARTHD